MANDVKWLKLMNNMFEDEKIEYIESLPDGDMILNVWIKTLCLASKCNDNGNLTITSELPYTTTLLAHKFKKTVTQIEYAFKIMQGLGMVEVNNDILCVSNWCKYQNVDELERLKEQNRLRVARCREKKKNGNATVMLQCNDFALNSISNIYDSNIYYNTLLSYLEVDCNVIYKRHQYKVNVENNLTCVGNILSMLDEIHERYSLEEIRERFRNVSKDYPVQPKYKNCDFEWLLNNLEKFKTASVPESQGINDIDFLIAKGFSKEWVMALSEEERAEKRKKLE